MDGKTNAGKLIGVTEYGKKLPPAEPIPGFAVKKEIRRMETEKDNLNEAEKTAPNPIYDEKRKSKRSLGKKGTLAMGAYPTEGVSWEDIDGWMKRHFPQLETTPESKEEVDRFLASMAKLGASEPEDTIGSMLEDYAAGLKRPVFSAPQAPAYRFPGYFNG